MAAAITRTQVYEAIKDSNCPVPDFTTREKTASIWHSKVYISLQGDQVSFVELSGLQNILRWIFGYYSDTIIKDKATLKKVENYVNGILHASEVLKGVETDFMSLATTQADLRCLYDIVEVLRREENNPNNQATLDEEMHRLFPMKNVPGDLNFSEGFLKAALKLASKYPMIGGMLYRAVNDETNTLNLGLLRQVMGLAGLEIVPCQGLPISDQVKTAIRDEVSRLMYTRDHTGVMKSQFTRQDYLRLREWIATPCLPSMQTQQLYLAGERVEQDRTELSNKLVAQGADRALASLYVNDEASRDTRLVYHSEMKVCQLQVVQEKMSEIIKLLQSEIEQHYTIKVPADQNRAETIAGGGAIADLSGRAVGAMIEWGLGSVGLPNAGAVVGRTIQGAAGLAKGAADLASTAIEAGTYDRNIQELLTSYLPVVQDDRGLVSQIGWRARVVEAMKDPKYTALIEARIKQDTETPRKVADYLEWVKQMGAPIGLPELSVLSDISETALVVVKKVDEDYQWIGQFNFGVAKGPIVFCIDEKGILQPMELKTATSSTPQIATVQDGYLDEDVIFG